MTNEPKTNRARASAMAAAARRVRADAFDATILPIINSIKAEGIETKVGIAAALNERGVRTAKGGAWTDDQVRHLLKRTA